MWARCMEWQPPVVQRFLLGQISEKYGGGGRERERSLSSLTAIEKGSILTCCVCACADASYQTGSPKGTEVS